jgi:hypothetical protein
LAQKVIAKLPSTGDQLAFAQRLPEPLAASALEHAWQNDPPDPSETIKAAQSISPGPLHDILITTASRSIQQNESPEAWQAWVEKLPASDRANAMKAATETANESIN